MNIIGIYPGVHQPPTLGDYKSYEYLKKFTEVNTFVTTSDVIDLPNSPLSFRDKQQIWTRHGVSIDKIILTKDPTKALEVTKKFGSDRTVVVFGMSSKDTAIALQSKSGYFLQFKGVSQSTEPLNKHVYILAIPDEILFINKSVNNTSIRQVFGSKKLSEDQKKSFFKQIFGWYDISLFDLIKKKFFEANTVKERVNEQHFTDENISCPIIRRTLKTFVKEILGQLTTPQGTDTSTPISSEPALTPSQIQKDKSEKEKQRQRQIKQKEVELQTAKKERDFQKQKIDQVNRFTIPNTTKDIQSLKGAKI